MRRESGRMVCVGFLRTQQRAKSQCIKHNLVNASCVYLGRGVRLFLAMEASLLHGGALLVGAWRALRACRRTFNGEFDPGSGRTLAACLTHASRAERPFGVLERRTGE